MRSGRVNLREQIWEQVQAKTLIVTAFIIDALFLLLWVATERLLIWGIDYFQLQSQVHQIALQIAHIFFVSATFFPIAIMIYKDIRVLLQQTKQQIDEGGSRLNGTDHMD